LSSRVDTRRTTDITYPLWPPMKALPPGIEITRAAS
jgi:hypothetical protein